ncbi:hypothetical protein BH10BAC2_BH10BAC2_42260 [soil metagenome]
MKTFFHSCIFAALLHSGFSITANAQLPADSTASAMPHLVNGKSLFETDAILEITLSGNVKELLNDRAENSQYHPILLSYKGEDSSEVAIPVAMKTRGHFRKLKENCSYPPLQISFSKNDLLQSSVFKEQEKMKLVMPCKDDGYVIREWLVYKLYNLVSPKSFKARLVSVKMKDTKNKKTAVPFYGILLEEEKQMAKRNGLIPLNKKIQPAQTERQAFLNMAVFEYMTGNTDWGIQYLQNVKLLALDSNAVPIAVPYDFDHAGIVDAPYANPAEELQMSSVRERRYRGFCIEDMQQFASVINLYNSLKNEIYSTYTDCKLLDEKYIKTTIKYLDDFYATINNPAALKKEFGYPCDKNGTGNIIIKGLREE